jgi:uncharacterized membrane protein YkoI
MKKEPTTMSQRTTLVIAATVTAFVLVLAGGLASQLSQASSMAPSAVATDALTQATAGASLDPALEALIQEREAAYQTALAEANRRLEEANRQIAAANARIAEAPASQAPAAAPAASSYAVSAEQAQGLALAAAPGATLARPVELVSYQGAPAYEVILDRGTLYIDAQSGAVLANGAAPALDGAVSAEQAAQVAVSYRGGGTVREVEREDEHGALVYEVKFTDGSRIYVDATTGQVVYARAGDGDEREHAGDEHND